MVSGCPTCGVEGEYFEGPPRAERDHFIARALWDLHRARQAQDKLTSGSADLSDEFSEVCRKLDEIVLSVMELEQH